jgi:hypothetical protein
MGDTHSRWEQGNLLFYDSHRKRILDAIGPDVIKYLEDFVGGPGADAVFDNFWTVTRVEAGGGESTIAKSDGAGGVAQISTDLNENDGINMQLLGESFKLITTAGSQSIVYFGIRLKLGEATQSDLFAGLAITDTDILGGVTDAIGFTKVDGSTSVKTTLQKDSTETLSASVLTADTSYHILEFYFDGSKVEFFVDGVSVGVPAVTNLPNDEELRPSVHFLSGSAGAKTLDIDWIRVVQVGGRIA